MSLASVPEILDDIRAGRMVILMDDEDRENEGDLIIAAEKVTPEIINFMATEACGLICMPITEERARQLRIPLMVATTAHNTKQTLPCPSMLPTKWALASAPRNEHTPS